MLLLSSSSSSFLSRLDFFLSPATTAMSDSAASILAAHAIRQTLDSIATLESLNLITSPDAQIIRSKLPSPAGPFPALDAGQQRNPQTTLPSAFSNLNVGGGNNNNGPISPHDYRGGPQSPMAPSQSQQFSQSPPSPYPPPALPPRSHSDSQARALWDYNGTVSDRTAEEFPLLTPFTQENDDLSFRSGDTVIIDEEGKVPFVSELNR